MVEYIEVRLHQMHPVNGPTAGGTKIIIKGVGFVISPFNEDKCVFDGLAVVPVISLSTHEATCITPFSAASKTTHVTLQLSAVTVDAGLLFHYLEPLPIEGAYPALGPVHGATSVIITGIPRILQEYWCRFGTIIARAWIIKSGHLQCISPPHSVGYATLAVSANHQNYVNISRFEYVRPAELIAVKPSSGPSSGGTFVSALGDNFHARSASLFFLQCRFNATVVSAVFVSIHEVKCYSPEFPPGIAGMAMTQNLEDFSDELPFQYTHARLIRLSPIGGPAAGHTLVHVLGDGFSPGEVYCHFDGLAVSGSFVSRNMMSCISPGYAAGNSAIISVTISEALLDSTLTYWFVESPKVWQVLPRHGPLLGGTSVTLHGIFMPIFDYTCVFGQIAVPARMYADNRLACTTPRREIISSETLSVVPITRDRARSALEQASALSGRFEFHAAYYITHLEPCKGPMAGGSLVRVSANHIPHGNSLYCLFNTSAVPATRTSVQMAICKTPSVFSVGYVAVALSAGIQSASSDGIAFEFQLAYLRSIAPRFGPASGGTRIIIWGTQILPACLTSGVQAGVRAALSCIFDCGAANVNAVPATQVAPDSVTCTTPVHLQGSLRAKVAVRVFNASYHFENSESDPAGHAQFFRYLRPAQMSRVWPPTGPSTGGTRVQARKNVHADAVPTKMPKMQHVFKSYVRHPLAYGPSNVTLLHPSRVCQILGSHFHDNAQVKCRFQSHAEYIHVNARWRTPHRLDCVSPPSNASRLHIRVTWNGQDYTPQGLLFEYAGHVFVTRIFPSRVPSEGGTRLQLHGSGFPSSPKHHSLLRCVFDSHHTSATYVSSSRIDCLTPPRLAGVGTVEVSVNTMDFAPGGQLTFVAAFISWVAPSSGPVDGGTRVYVHMSGALAGFHLCHFGAQSTPATLDASSLLGCVSPVAGRNKGGSVHLQVSVDAVTIATGSPFIYSLPQYPFQILPLGGPENGGTVVIISGINLDGSTSVCRFNNIVVQAIPIINRWGSITSLQCISPRSVKPGHAIVEVGRNGQQFSDGRLVFRYFRSIRAMGIEPTFGPPAGGIILNFDVHGIDPSFIIVRPELACAFNTTSVPALLSDHMNRIHCVLPPHPPGIVEVSLDLNGQRLSTVSFFFHYKVTFINEIRPSQGPVLGGTLVLLVGSNFPVLLTKCDFGGAHVNATAYSTTGILCRAPAKHSPGIATVSLLCSDVKCANSVTFDYYDNDLNSYSASPLAGPAKGGTTVHIFSSQALRRRPVVVSGHVSCRFGDHPMASVVKAVLQPTQFHCVTPASMFGSFQVYLSFNGQQFAPVGAHSFTYQRDIVVTFVTPSRGPAGGGTTVLLRGQHLDEFDTHLLYCRFEWKQPVLLPGTRTTTGALRCTTPAMHAGYYSVSATGNGVDCSNSLTFEAVVSGRATHATHSDTSHSHLSTIVSVFGTAFTPDFTACSILAAMEPAYFESTDAVRCLFSVPRSQDGRVELELHSNYGNKIAVPSMYFNSPSTSIVMVSPTQGPLQGGTTVTIVTRLLHSTVKARTYCRFGDHGLVPAIVDGPHIVCVSPKLADTHCPMQCRQLRDAHLLSFQQLCPQQCTTTVNTSTGNAIPIAASIDIGGHHTVDCRFTFTYQPELKVYRYTRVCLCLRLARAYTSMPVHEYEELQCNAIIRATRMCTLCLAGCILHMDLL